MKNREQILLEENELKPNRYVANVMLFSIPVIALVNLLNDLGIFHVERTSMDICVAVAVICAMLIQLFGRVDFFASKSVTKYIVMSLVFAEVLVLTVTLSQWTELLIALPIALAMQYHDMRLAVFSAAGSLLIAFTAAPLSVLLALPQLDFYDFLIRSIGYQVQEIAENPDYDRVQYALLVLLYVGLPRGIVVGGLVTVMMYITKLVSRNVQNRAEITYLSTTDVLTGILNRLSYESQLRDYSENRPQCLVCIYGDADGLHELNNQEGHSAGDELLKTCARQMCLAFGPNTFRLGGDEFLSFMELDSVEAADAGIARVREAMAQRGYHVSLGVGVLKDGMSIEELVNLAEERMSAAKRKYYSEEADKDRRRAR